MGGIAREDDYQYLGQDNFCKKEFMAYSDKHQSKLIKVKVGTVKGGHALMTACWVQAYTHAASEQFLRLGQPACPLPHTEIS